MGTLDTGVTGLPTVPLPHERVFLSLSWGDDRQKDTCVAASI